MINPLKAFRKYAIAATSVILKIGEYYSVFMQIEKAFKTHVIDGGGIKGGIQDDNFNALIDKFLPIIYGCIDNRNIKDKGCIYYLALMLLKRGKHHEAKHLMDKALEVLSIPPALIDKNLPESIADYWCEFIEDQSHETTKEEAANYLLEILDRVIDDKTKARCLTTIATVKESLGEFQDAIEFLEQASALDKTLKLSTKISNLKKQLS